MRVTKTFRFLFAGFLVAAVIVAGLLVAGPKGALRSQGDLPAAKQTALDRIEQIQATAAANQVDSGEKSIPLPTGPSPTPLFDPQVPAGDGTIVLSGHTPLHSSQYTIENYWYMTAVPYVIEVDAGARTDDPAQGVVVVTVFPRVQPTSVRLPPPGVYDTPIRTGTVHVVGASGEQLQLEASDGTAFEFDVSSRILIVLSTPAKRATGTS